MENKYLIERTLYPRLIKEETALDLQLILVIPAYKEENLSTSLRSLYESSKGCKGIEVILVVNGRESDAEAVKKLNEMSVMEAKVLAKEFITDDFRIHVLYFPDQPNKKSGVGVARKIGLDEGLRRFKQVGNEKGILVCFDADSTCSKNYIAGILDQFKKDNVYAISIYFEHPLHIEEPIKKAIAEYELHLRCYINFQRLLGLPFAYYTIGSSMAVRSDIYEKLWGMNKRKAGEDFYFLQKFIKQGHFAELNTATVFPSSRKSDRVPFGTGKAVNDLLSRNTSQTTYNPKSYEMLKVMLDDLKCFYGNRSIKEKIHSFPALLRNFLTEIKFEEKIAEIKDNTGSFEAFVKRFFHWFDAFMLMKYLHYCRDKLPNISVLDASKILLNKLGLQVSEIDLYKSLELLRKYDQGK